MDGWGRVILQDLASQLARSYHLLVSYLARSYPDDLQEYILGCLTNKFERGAHIRLYALRLYAPQFRQTLKTNWVF